MLQIYIKPEIEICFDYAEPLMDNMDSVGDQEGGDANQGTFEEEDPIGNKVGLWDE